MSGNGHQILKANWNFIGSEQYIYINSGCTLEIQPGGDIK